MLIRIPACRRYRLLQIGVHYVRRYQSHYSVLGIPQTASQKQIREAFIEKSKQHHPDQNRHDKSSHDKFVRINEAYTILSKKSSREEYDLKLRYKSQYGPQDNIYQQYPFKGPPRPPGQQGYKPYGQEGPYGHGPFNQGPYGHYGDNPNERNDAFYRQKYEQQRQREYEAWQKLYEHVSKTSHQYYEQRKEADFDQVRTIMKFSFTVYMMFGTIAMAILGGLYASGSLGSDRGENEAWQKLYEHISKSTHQYYKQRNEADFVRLRTAIKFALAIYFIFGSIAVTIIAGLYALGILTNDNGSDDPEGWEDYPVGGRKLNERTFVNYMKMAQYSVLFIFWFAGQYMGSWDTEEEIKLRRTPWFGYANLAFFLWLVYLAVMDGVSKLMYSDMKIYKTATLLYGAFSLIFVLAFIKRMQGAEDRHVRNTIIGKAARNRQRRELEDEDREVRNFLRAKKTIVPSPRRVDD